MPVNTKLYQSVFPLKNNATTVYTKEKVEPLLNSKKNSIIIKILFGFFIIMALSLLAHTAIFSNLNSFSYFLSYYSVIKNIIYVFKSMEKL